MLKKDVAELRNNAKRTLERAIERKKQAQKQTVTMVLVDKKALEKLKADLDYVAMMSDVELEEVTNNE